MDLSTYILSEEDFERLTDQNDNYTDMSYNSFMDWNIQCINELTNKDRLWLTGLCTRMGQNSIRIMDLESCVAFPASHFYFDHKKRICIINQQ